MKITTLYLIVFIDGGGSASRPRHNSCHAGGWSTPARPQLPDSTPPAQPPITPTQPVATPDAKGERITNLCRFSQREQIRQDV